MPTFWMLERRIVGLYWARKASFSHSIIKIKSLPIFVMRLYGINQALILIQKHSGGWCQPGCSIPLSSAAPSAAPPGMRGSPAERNYRAQAARQEGSLTMWHPTLTQTKSPPPTATPYFTGAQHDHLIALFANGLQEWVKSSLIRGYEVWQETSGNVWDLF